MRWTNAVISAAKKCEVDIASLYELYGILSNQIHGHPWSGPSLLIISKDLSSQHVNFIKSLAGEVGMEVEVEKEEPKDLSETALKSGET